MTPKAIAAPAKDAPMAVKTRRVVSALEDDMLLLLLLFADCSDCSFCFSVADVLLLLCYGMVPPLHT